MSFEDMMYDEGFTDPEAFLGYLQKEADEEIERFERRLAEREKFRDDFEEDYEFDHFDSREFLNDEPPSTRPYIDDGYGGLDDVYGYDEDWPEEDFSYEDFDEEIKPNARKMENNFKHGNYSSEYELDGHTMNEQYVEKLKKMLEDFIEKEVEVIEDNGEDFYIEWENLNDYLYYPESNEGEFFIKDKHEFRKKYYCTMTVEKSGETRLLVRRKGKNEACYDLGKFKLAHNNKILFVREDENEVEINVLENLQEKTILYSLINQK